MNKNIEDLTIGELTEMGFSVSAMTYWCENLQDSYEKTKPFTELSNIERKQYDGEIWTVVRGHVNGQEVSFTAFIE